MTLCSHPRVYRLNGRSDSGGQRDTIVCRSFPPATAFLLRKEVIQPHFPVRLPCYDFTPLTRHTFGTVLHCWLDERLRVPPTRVV
jgi:hypothetical protein